MSRKKICYLRIIIPIDNMVSIDQKDLLFFYALRLDFDELPGEAMTAYDVLTIFERLNTEGRADIPLDEACAGFAGWLADNWGCFEGDDLAVLTSVGATLWREGFAQRQK